MTLGVCQSGLMLKFTATALACPSAGEALACALSLLSPYQELSTRAQAALAHADLSLLAKTPSILCVLQDGSLQPPATRLLPIDALLAAICRIQGVLGSSIAQDNTPHGQDDWAAMLAPAAAAHLCQQQQYDSAAALAVHHSGLHPAFATIDEGRRLLRLWLEAHERVLRGMQEPHWDNIASLYAPQAAERIWQSLPRECKAALHMLRQDMSS